MDSDSLPKVRAVPAVIKAIPGDLWRVELPHQTPPWDNVIIKAQTHACFLVWRKLR